MEATVTTIRAILLAPSPVFKPSLPGLAALSAILATAILSMRPEWLFAVFVLYGVSNAAWIVYALHKQERALLVQNLVFTLTTVIGLIQNWP
jgi:hypothetical protein